MPVSVLVVDDDPGFRDLASRLIAELGMTVVARVGSVAAAVAAADELRPQAALVDFGLRTVTGSSWPPCCPSGLGDRASS